MEGLGGGRLLVGGEEEQCLGGVDWEETSTPVPAADSVRSIPPPHTTRQTFPSTHIACFAKPTTPDPSAERPSAFIDTDAKVELVRPIGYERTVVEK